MIVLTRVVQTCEACPSQWDAWDTDGTYYYLRFRHGHGRIESEEVGDENRAYFISRDKDGYITLSDFMAVSEVSTKFTLSEHVELSYSC